MEDYSEVDEEQVAPQLGGPLSHSSDYFIWRKICSLEPYCPPMGASNVPNRLCGAETWQDPRNNGRSDFMELVNPFLPFFSVKK